MIVSVNGLLWRCSHFPSSPSKESYFSQQKNFEKILHSTPGVIAAFSFGELEAPGVSDLDYVVVVDENSFTSLNYDKKIYFFIDDPLIIPQSLVSSFSLIFDTSRLKKVFGEISFPTCSKDFFIVESIDFFFKSLPRNTIQMIRSRKIHVKRSLSLLYDIRKLFYYDAKLSFLQEKTKLDVEGLVKELKVFRKSKKFDHEFSRKLIAYLLRTNELSLRCLDDFSAYLSNKLFPSRSSKFFYSGAFPTIFTNKKQKLPAVLSRLVFLPSSFGQFYAGNIRLKSLKEHIIKRKIFLDTYYFFCKKNAIQSRLLSTFEYYSNTTLFGTVFNFFLRMRSYLGLTYVRLFLFFKTR